MAETVASPLAVPVDAPPVNALTYEKVRAQAEHRRDFVKREYTKPVSSMFIERKTSCGDKLTNVLVPLRDSNNTPPYASNTHVTDYNRSEIYLTSAEYIYTETWGWCMYLPITDAYVLNISEYFKLHIRERELNISVSVFPQ